jgi:hypothetical protein
MEKTFAGAHVINVDLGNWGGALGKVLSMRYMFSNAIKFEGNRLDTWIVSTVTTMADMFDFAALTSCNKRKIVDAWSSSAVFNYGSAWASDTCVGAQFSDADFKTASWGTYNHRFILYHTYTP